MKAAILMILLSLPLAINVVLLRSEMSSMSSSIASVIFDEGSGINHESRLKLGPLMRNIQNANFFLTICFLLYAFGILVFVTASLYEWIKKLSSNASKEQVG